MNDATIFNHVGPHFLIQDVSRSIEFYVRVLGLLLEYVDGSPPLYAVVFRDDVYIHLSRTGAPGYPSGPGCAFISVSGVDELWQRVAAAKPEIVEPLADKDFGHGVLFRVFTIRDPDGNVLRIGQPMDPQDDGPAA